MPGRRRSFKSPRYAGGYFRLDELAGWGIFWSFKNTAMIITNAIVTAYCCCTLCCGKQAAGIAANGKAPVEGVTVAGPRNIPLGTQIHIEGIGYRVVTDRTAKRFDGRFDIYFRDHDDAKKFGKQKLKITIYDSLRN